MFFVAAARCRSAAPMGRRMDRVAAADVGRELLVRGLAVCENRSQKVLNYILPSEHLRRRGH